MANSTGAQTILLDLNTNNAQRLLLEPAFNYDSITQRNLGIFHFEFGKDKLRMLHMSKPTNNLQPRSNCDTWNPTVRVQLRGDEITVCDFEVNGEQCSDEFDVACLRNLKGDNPATNPNESQALTALENAMVQQVRAGISDDVYKVAYFGDPLIRVRLAAEDINLDHLSPDEKEKFLIQMETCEGWWSEIQNRTYSTIDAQKIRYVNSNDGTVGGNALNPANVADFLRDLRNKSSMILKNWNRNRSAAEYPLYMVQGGIFQAYRTYLQSLGTEMANVLILNGEMVPGVLMFEGYRVVEIPEWDMYDAETGNYNDTTGHSNIQRALFTAPENLTGLANMRDIEMMPGTGLAIQVDPIIKNKGKKYMYYAFGMGFGVAQPQLMTASWNSSQSFIYA